jgi:hypothetical protein
MDADKTDHPKWWSNRFLKLPIWLWIAIATIGLMGSIGAGDDSTTTASNPTLSPGTSTSGTTLTPDTKPSQSTDDPTELNLAGGNDPEDFLMPNVVCMNLQEAQDEIQDHGVFLSRSVDLTGQNRSQLIDSNWIVLEQTPAPGTKVAEGEAVLGVVKIDESTRGIC